MDETDNSASSWLSARLGRAVDTYVDNEIYKRQGMDSYGAAYGMDEHGNIYQVGQPNVQTAALPRTGISTQMMLLILAGVFFAMHK